MTSSQRNSLIVMLLAGAAGYAFYRADTFWGVVVMGLTFVWAIVTALPIMDSEPPLPHHPRYLDVHRGTAPQGPVILVVEDHGASRFLLQTYLERAGYSVRLARDGRAAVLAAAERDVALIVMDIQLPVLDGREATRRIRARGQPTPIIVLTAHATARDAALCFAAGANAYLDKPIDLQALVRTICALLDASKTLPSGRWMASMTGSAPRARSICRLSGSPWPRPPGRRSTGNR